MSRPIPLTLMLATASVLVASFCIGRHRDGKKLFSGDPSEYVRL